MITIAVIIICMVAFVTGVIVGDVKTEKAVYKRGYNKGYNSKRREAKRQAGEPIKGVEVEHKDNWIETGREPICERPSDD